MRHLSRSILVLAVTGAVAWPPGGVTSGQTTAPAENAAAIYRKAFSLLPRLSKEERELLSGCPGVRAAPLDTVALGLIEKSGPALAQLRRAAGRARCDWQTNKKDGSQAALSHLPQAALAAKLGFLTARHHFAQGRPKEAVDDWAGALTLGRRIGPAGPLACLDTQIATENTAAEIAAKHAARLPPAVLKALAKRLDAVGQGADLAGALRREKKYVEKSSRASPLYRQAVEFYDKAARIGHLPPDQMSEKLKAMQSPMAAIVGPAIRRRSYVHAQAQVKMQMLRAAVAVLRGGKAKLSAVRDPYGKGPFQYRSLKKGFQLTSQLAVDDKPVTLTVPAED